MYDGQRRELHIVVLLVVTLAGCAVRSITPELTHFDPDAGYRWDPARVLPDNDPQTILVVTLSGGGPRRPPTFGPIAVTDQARVAGS